MTPRPLQTAAGGEPDPVRRPCPYCRAQLQPGHLYCGQCGRDPSAPRRPCLKCGRVTPSAEQACMSCGAIYKSDMRWKIPLIVGLFLFSFVLSVAAALVTVLLR